MKKAHGQSPESPLSYKGRDPIKHVQVFGVESFSSRNRLCILASRVGFKGDGATQRQDARSSYA